MLHLVTDSSRMCDGLSRREFMTIGGAAALGLSQVDLLSAKPGGRRPKSCIILFLLGGPPQHSTWDPKPDTPAEVRGPFGPIATSASGIQICELLPKTARVMHHVALLRGVSTGDNAHSSSGYYMMTGRPHAPMNAENANPGPPNDWPTLAAMIGSVSEGRSAMPAAVRVPQRIFNTDGSVWPGQDAGFFGRRHDPWLLNCRPADKDFSIPEFTLKADISQGRLTARRSLLEQFNDQLRVGEKSGKVNQYDTRMGRALNVLTSAEAQGALKLELESEAVRDRYGRHQFGQSVLLARRMVEAGVAVAQVNWFRGPDEPSDAPCWDTHVNEPKRLKENLCPGLDETYSALIEDLEQRGRLDDTLVVCMAEFGRTPRLYGNAGRNHWGGVFSIALAGCGIKGGMVHGESDAIGSYPKSGMVQPPDILATILQCLDIDPHHEFHDAQGRPFVASTGRVIDEVLA